ncbi:MAG: bifunctional hydroxymethylpyrimidine kinase/phosphomethylpyrimidine kinase, partial [Deltaproteobacteria bacterium]|nr:bifunctional hydroxymethylpyrimidine kinase/phosphomethylpyrimidine kinase [Deltaproteobacteria bacterium]
MTDNSSQKQYCRVLTIAGSDSGGGAGIQADLKTISANGCYGMTVITALTAQNTVGVTAIHPVPVHFVEQQMEAVLTDIGTDAVKIGMLFSPELIKCVADQLCSFKIQNIVLDPVMVATSGDKLLLDDAIEALKEYLLPLADIITPNLPEAGVLLGREIKSLAELEQAAEELAGLGCSNILIKGGHLQNEESDDLLYLGDEKRSVLLPGMRVATHNTHGTGCTLSSAIASYMARGKEMEEAVLLAKEYITGAIIAGADYQIGHGHGPVHHFY